MHNTFWSVKLTMQGYIPYLLVTVMTVMKKGSRQLAVILGSSQNLRVGVARFLKSRALIFCLLPSKFGRNFDHFPSIWEGSQKFYYVAFFPQIIIGRPLICCEDSMQGK